MNNSTTNSQQQPAIPLSLVPPTQKVTLSEWGDISHELREYLQGFGLVLNQHFTVSQQQPMPIIKIDELEVALESKIAKSIWVSITHNNM